MSLSQPPRFDRDLSGHVIIIGAGCAGIETGLALRGNGWRGPISIFEEEDTWPYHRPPLSKAMLKSCLPEAEYRNRTPEVMARADIDLHLGEEVAAINRVNKTIRLTGDCAALSYTNLVFATGGRARNLGSFPHLIDCQNVYVLRTLADAIRIRGAFTKSNRLVIVGGGFIGLEVAAAARAKGIDVQILEAGPRILERTLPELLSDYLHAMHERAGVSIHTNVEIEDFEIDITNVVRRVRFDQNAIECDILVVAVGQEPNTVLAEMAGLHVSNGISVNEAMQTEDPAIFAVGDCARFYSGRYEGALRLESVPNALAHARKVSTVLCGIEIPSEEIPWFWTDQFDLNLKIVGLPQQSDKMVVRGKVDDRAFSVVFHTEGHVNCVYAVNRPSDFVAGKRLIDKALKLDVAQLSDDTIPLLRLAPR